VHLSIVVVNERPHFRLYKRFRIIGRPSGARHQLDLWQLQQQIADELGDRQDLLLPLSDSALSQSPIQNASNRRLRNGCASRLH
jgi:hypothetical protein